jgi:hypothetical protein
MLAICQVAASSASLASLTAVAGFGIAVTSAALNRSRLTR